MTEESWRGGGLWPLPRRPYWEGRREGSEQGGV